MAEFSSTWVLVADSARARIFEWTSHGGPLKELDDRVNSEGRQKESELVGDRPGSSFSSTGHSSGHPTQPRHSAVETAADEFARSLTAALKSGLETQQCERLVLVAPPAFLGQLRSHLDRRLEQAVAASVDSNLTRASAEDILERLPKLSNLG